MKVEELKDYYGTWTKLSRELDFGVSTYRNWILRDGIPYGTQLLIQDKTNGQFTADRQHEGGYSK